MPTVREELDVFHVPHSHMKKVVHDIEDQLFHTNFQNAEEYVYLLEELSRNFHDLQSHEDIENNYIMSPLLPRLNGLAKASLEHDLHSSNHLDCLMVLVDSAPQFVNELERLQYGETLKTSVISFTSEVIPHMDEEEEVFQPLLIEYYTESELIELRNTVLLLHNQRISKGIQHRSNTIATPTTLPSHAPFVLLPQEILLKILSYLGPRDLCRISQTHPLLTQLAFDGSLWPSLHPVRWANGHWQFYFPSPLLDKADLSYDSIISNNTTKYLLTSGNSVNALLCNHGDGCYDDDEEDPQLLREGEIMRGLIDYVLPKIGSHVEVLDLAYGKSLTGEMINIILYKCPNIRYLDLSHTKVTDYSFRGLVDSSNSRHLISYIDLSGCALITDTTLLRIAWASTPLQTTPTYCCDCSCGDESIYDKGGGGIGGVVKKDCELKCLILSGCHQITDVGLSSLAVGCGLPNLQYLDLTSVPRISSTGLNSLVLACPNLKPHLLYYCDNIANGPHPFDSNGCCNVENSYHCCQNMYMS